MRFTVQRERESKDGTFGRLLGPDGAQVAVTVERRWVDADADGKRDRGVSRIAAGAYKCFLRKSHLNGGTGKRKYDVWQLKDVPDTTAAQVHIANTAEELEGCIGVGLLFGNVLRGGRLVEGVLNSRDAHDRFLVLTADEKEITLVVKDIA